MGGHNPRTSVGHSGAYKIWAVSAPLSPAFAPPMLQSLRVLSDVARRQLAVVHAHAGCSTIVPTPPVMIYC
eukprot:363474-Chlamydomonas_euryale.AAC.10